MNKLTKRIVALILVACMVIPGSLLSGVLAEDGKLELRSDNYYGNKVKADDGFVEGDLLFTKALSASSLSEIAVEINGKPAYWNVGYLGAAHCALQQGAYRTEDGGGVYTGVDRDALQLGIVGAELKAGDGNTFKIIDKNGDTYETTFNSSHDALGISYATATADSFARTVEIKVIFNEDPGFTTGDTFFEGRTHDEHNNTGVFKVTAYDPDTEMYTISSDYFATQHSLLEMRCTSGSNTDKWFSLSVNSNNVLSRNSDNKITLSNPKAFETNNSNSSFSDANRLIDGRLSGDACKLEGVFPSGGVTITFEADTSKGVPGTIVFGTNDDGDWPNRAPKAVVVYGSDSEGGRDEILLQTDDVKISNIKEAYFAVEINSSKAYKYYTVDIVSNKGNGGYFQIAEIEMYTGAAADMYSVQAGGNAFIGTDPNKDAIIEIRTEEEFLAISGNRGANYKLMNDITVTRFIGLKNDGSSVDQELIFSGVFDGNGYTITVNFTDTDYRTGLFAQAGGENCVIKNLTVDGTITSRNNSAGGVVGTAKGNITFENIISKVTIDASGSDSDDSSGNGGILGVNEGNTVTFKNCISVADITGRRAVGGFIGMVRNGGSVETFENCTFNGKVHNITEWSDKRAAGGFIGTMHYGTNDEVNVTFRNCASNGEVISDYVLASAWVGSYARYGHADQLPVLDNCTQTAKVTIMGYEISKINNTLYPEAHDTESNGSVKYDGETISGGTNMAMNDSSLAAAVNGGYKVYVNGVLDETAVATASGRRLEVVCNDPTVTEGELISIIVVFENGHFTTLGQSSATGTDSRVGFTKKGANAESTDPEKNFGGDSKNKFELSPAEGKDFSIYYQTRRGENGTVDYRFIVVATEEYLNSLNSATITVTFGEKSIDVEVKEAYLEIDATVEIDDETKKEIYKAADGCGIVGVVITGVPADIVLNTSVIEFIGE